ncbi:MAG: hypothetical protein AB1668_04530 [Nanoarchaeota archaeon]
MATLEERIAIAASLHPLLAVKLKLDAMMGEEEKNGGQKYKLLYEKTYPAGNSDGYESTIVAKTDEAAIRYAQEELYLTDVFARWDTNITDAFLIAPNGGKILVPPYSKKLREVEEREKKRPGIKDRSVGICADNRE